MEQAVNNFTKGLQMDTNPMIQGNDTLTDCLNGTLITMNGNEVILQNDMGNRRVDNAFLPSGYQPVGMKEFGGIIYIAAYNPITNKSQIGSFPSPQRKIDKENSLTNNFDFDSFFQDRENDEGKFISQDTFLIPLTENTSLHAGDKFAIYCTNLSSMQEQITNYNNIGNSHTKALSPKNRKYTIKLGILNSQNEFIDITKTLCRWEDTGDKWSPKNYDSSYSDIYKFNDGYFISDTFNNNDLLETIDDAEFIKHRQKIAVNTYAYKLIGPMYLQIQLNHIENFNYDISGTYTYDEIKNKKIAKLKITSYITYNCPDSNQPISDIGGNENYITFDEKIPDFEAFSLRKIDERGELEECSSKYFPSIYNTNTNTYFTKIEKIYDSIIPDEGDVYNYFIGVIADKDRQYDYLKGLSIKSSIDLSLLGSGLIKIKEWKFYNTIEQNSFSFLLKLNLESYPEPDKQFSNLRFKFEDVNDKSKFYFPKSDVISYENEIPIFNGISLYNGIQTIDINNENSDLQNNKLYKVSIYYDIIDTNSIEHKELKENIDRWFLTTELLNEFYNDYNINDYCNENETKNNNSFNDKFIIKFYIEDNISEISGSKNREEFGKFITEEQNSLIRLGVKNSSEFIIEGHPNIKIVNKDLYPDFIEVNNIANNLLKFDSQRANYNLYINGIESNSEDDIIFKSNVELIKSTNCTQSAKDLGNMFNCNIIGLESRKLKLYLENLDFYCGKGSTKVTNAIIFNRISELANEIPINDDENKIPYYGGLGLDTVEKGNGHNDVHRLYLYAGLYSPILDTKESTPRGITHFDQGLTDSWSVLEKIEEDGNGTVFNVTKYTDIINSKFEKFNQQGQVFKFCTQPSQSSGKYEPGGWNHCGKYQFSATKSRTISDITGSDYARVWWKTNTGEWALINSLYSISNGDPVNLNSGQSEINGKNLKYNFKNYLNKVFNKDYIYCTHFDYQGNDLNYYFADTDYSYNSNYSIPIKIIPIYYINSNIQICNEYSIGNIKFSYDKTKDSFKSSNSITKILKSDDSFIRKIENFNFNPQITIDLVTGNCFDSEGQSLDKNQIYYIKNNELYKEKDYGGLFHVDDSNKTESGANTITYVNQAIVQNSPEFRYDSLIGSNKNGDSFLDYEGVLLVSKNICK